MMWLVLAVPLLIPAAAWLIIARRGDELRKWWEHI